jgi:aminoglycoside phosphotransferase (APT) family kinase protein
MAATITRAVMVVNQRKRKDAVNEVFVGQVVEVPGSLGEVDVAWVNSALDEGGQAHFGLVTEVSVQPITDFGVLAELGRLHLRYAEDDAVGPASLVLKLQSEDPEARNVAALVHMYEREVGLYRDLAPLGGVPAPTCYWCSAEAPSGAFGILLADVGHLGRDDQRLGISGPRLGTAVAGLAELHARWWESAALRQFGWLPPFDTPWLHVVYEKYREVWPVFFERFGAKLPDGSERFGGAAADAMHRTAGELANGPVTLAHGDYRTDNLFFEGAPERVVAIDWQLSAQMVGTADIALLLTEGASVELRRRREWDVLRSWHDRISAHAATPYSYEDAMDDYRRFALHYLVHPVLGGALIDPGDRRHGQVGVIAERAFCAAIDLGLEDLL